MNMSMSEIICMFQKRGNSFKMPENGKKAVTLQILAHLKRNLQYQNLECSLEDVTIINKINKLIEEAEAWGKNRTRLMNNPTLLREKREKHSVDFDITGKEFSHTTV